MKKIKLYVYNYGRISQIADFKDAENEAYQCMKFLNDKEASGHSGLLPENVFYFLKCISRRTRQDKIVVDYGDSMNETWRQVKQASVLLNSEQEA